MDINTFITKLETLCGCTNMGYMKCLEKVEDLIEEKDLLWEKASKSITDKLKLYSENKKLKEEISDMEDKCIHQEDVYDWVEADGKVILDEDEYEEMQETIENLKEENEKLKEQRKPVTRSDTRIKQLEKQVEKLTWEISVYDHSIVKGLKEEIKKLKQEQFDEIEKIVKQQEMCLVDISIFDKLIEKEEENEKLKEEIKQLKEEHSKDIQYFRCYLYCADRKGYAMPQKEDIDEWCTEGDVVDEKLKEFLYDEFCIDEDEDEDE